MRRLLARFAGGHVKGKGDKGALQDAEYTRLLQHCNRAAEGSAARGLAKVLEEAATVSDG